MGSSMGTVPGQYPPGYPPPLCPPPAQHTTSWMTNQGNTQPVGMGTDYGIWPKRPRIFENPANVDTVAVVGAHEKGLDNEALQAFFSELNGFITFKSNPRMGGGFVKFTSPQLAGDAAVVAESEGIPAAMAKSSMSNMN